MTVYVPQRPGRKNSKTGEIDFLPLPEAEACGELKVLMPFGPVVLQTEKTIDSLDELLKEFCDADYFLPLGDPVLIGMAATIAADYNHGRIKFLRWRKEEKDYTIIDCNL